MVPLDQGKCKGKTPQQVVPIPSVAGYNAGESVLRKEDRMTGLNGVVVDWRALTSVESLPPADRATLHETLARLAGQDPEHWPSDLVQRLPSEEPLYVLRLHGDLLVVFRRAEGGRLTIVDVSLKEMIDRYFRSAS
jgi:hypothetical protein